MDFSEIRNGIIFFTFDDAQYKDWLQQRELFRQYHAHATFFYSGELTEEHVQSMKLLQEDGHAVGLHSLHHKNCTFTEPADLEQYIKEEILPQLAVTEKAGIRTDCFAYPNNIHTPESDEALSGFFRRFRATLAPCPESADIGMNGAVKQRFYSFWELEETKALAGTGIGEYYHTEWCNLDSVMKLAAEKNKGVVFFSHGISENAPRIHMPTATLKHCLEFATSLGMRIASFDELD